MNKYSHDDFKSFEWDIDIIPPNNHKSIMVKACIVALLILILIGIFSDSKYLQGPFGWWPFIPFLGVFVYIGIAFSNLKCKLCGSKIK